MDWNEVESELDDGVGSAVMFGFILLFMVFMAGLISGGALVWFLN